MVTHQLQVERRTAKERWPETDVLPLSHADQRLEYVLRYVAMSISFEEINIQVDHIKHYFSTVLKQSEVSHVQDLYYQDVLVNVMQCHISKRVTCTVSVTF